MSNESPAIAQRKLPVWSVVKRSYLYIWEERRLFAVPLFLVFLLELAVAPLRQALEGHRGLSAPMGFAVIVISALLTAFAVGVYRTVLLGEERSGLAFFRGGRNFLRYVGTSLAMLLVPLLIAVLVILPASYLIKEVDLKEDLLLEIPVFSVVALAMLFVMLRFILALPGAAIGAEDRFSLSWKATKRNELRILSAFILVILFFVIPDVVLAILGEMVGVTEKTVSFSTLAGIVFQTITAAVATINVTGTTVMLSLAYQVLIGETPGEPASRS